MVWIGVRPNDVLSKLSPTVEAIRSSVLDRTARREPASSGGAPETATIAPGEPR